jgi:hypothetical protein
MILLLAKKCHAVMTAYVTTLNVVPFFNEYTLVKSISVCDFVTNKMK